MALIIAELAEALEPVIAGAIEAAPEEAEAAEVESASAVEEAADAPSLAENPSEAQSSSLGQRLKDLSIKVAKLSGIEGAKSGMVFGVFYMINKSLAEKSKSTGKKTKLSVYIKLVAENFNKLDIPFSEKTKEAAIDAAKNYPWISNDID
ncbi:hypothetical protein CJF42_21055 [Pseudoalteromonas sp. NBT06-2]|uniref:hypothetical protein n=1 Tax=Pseudoalteromonas sp. NBT06-2 TaxID=2025950 RepID=UPI000BA638A9|nr:hypothetical protein [Pseudoalteromonas sp. NBT06-2]PAJ72485.1 hypothetical protein CJF42_21055 [Pseudoalteromonas sp. NBT06-2]